MGSPYTATCDNEGVKALLQRLGPLLCWATHVELAALKTAMLFVLVAQTRRWWSAAGLQDGPHAACAEVGWPPAGAAGCGSVW
jgi:hypothetical protein